MKNRIFRLLVCLVLVCVILINCSPIRAQATGAEAILLSTVVVNPTIAITAILYGIGVMAVATATAAFTKLVNDCIDDLTEKGLIGANGVDMYRADADDAATYMVNQDLVEAVREYLWENEVVSQDLSLDGYCSYNGHIFREFTTSWTIPYWSLIEFSDGSYRMVLSQYRISYTSAYNSYIFQSPSPDYFSYEGDSWVHGGVMGTGYTSYRMTLDKILWTNYDLSKDGAVVLPGSEPVPASSIGVSDGLTAGEIASQDKSFTEGYSTWVSGALSLPTLRDGVQTDAESAYIALGMGLTQEETMAMTQAAVQSGVGTYEGSGTTADTITASGLKGWLDTIRLTLVSGFSDLIDGIFAIPSTIISGISSLFIPSAEAMAAQQEKWTTLLSDRFGAVYDSVALIDNIAGAFTLGATQTQIRFPLITIPFGDVNWEFGGWMVDVVPDGFEVLVDALKVGIDILCTLAFVNAMKSRLNRVLEGPA